MLQWCVIERVLQWCVVACAVAHESTMYTCILTYSVFSPPLLLSSSPPLLSGEVYRHTLLSMLDGALRSSNAQYDDEDVLKRLDVGREEKGEEEKRRGRDRCVCVRCVCVVRCVRSVAYEKHMCDSPSSSLSSSPSSLGASVPGRGWGDGMGCVHARLQGNEPI